VGAPLRDLFARGPAAERRCRTQGQDRICLNNVCFLTNVSLSGPPQATRLAWETEGLWNRCPDATLSVHIVQVTDTQSSHHIARLVRNVPYDAQVATVDLSGYHGKQFRLILRKDGDPETGGQSDTFDLE
jgi:hypothetical protein